MALSPRTVPARTGRRARSSAGIAAQRLRPRLLPIAHTAAAAVIAWYLALAVVPDPRPSFASIAAVISVGATYGHRGRRAAELIGGVVLGLSVADVVVRLIGVAVPRRIVTTSSGVSSGLASIISATTPVTCGAAKLVPCDVV